VYRLCQGNLENPLDIVDLPTTRASGTLRATARLPKVCSITLISQAAAQAGSLPRIGHIFSGLRRLSLPAFILYCLAHE